MGMRRRYLPHWYEVGTALFVTFRLHGSLPVGRHFPSCLTSGQVFVCMDRLLDRQVCGPLYLGLPEVAEIVARAIREAACEMHAWVVMPNHVHLLFTPLREVAKMLQTLKGVTAREANLALGRTGQFWQHESYDRLVRDEAEFRRIAKYIVLNPVRAGLCGSPELYRWSSAWGRRS